MASRLTTGTVVTDLAAEVVGVSGALTGTKPVITWHTNSLSFLSALRTSTGPCPAPRLLALTNVKATAEREPLLLAGYREAEERADLRNQAWIALKQRRLLLRCVPAPLAYDSLFPPSLRQLRGYPTEPEQLDCHNASGG